MCAKNPDAFSKAHRAMWFTGSVAVTFGRTFAQPRATYSTHPMPVPGGYAFAHSDSSRAAALSRSASSLCPPSGKTFPFLYDIHRRGTSVSFPYKTGGLDVCIISRSTQFVNRLILLFSRMYFLHDNFALTGGILYSGSLAGKAGVCTLIRRYAPPSPGWGKAFAPAGFRKAGNAPAAKKDCHTNAVQQSFVSL